MKNVSHKAEILQSISEFIPEKSHLSAITVKNVFHKGEILQSISEFILEKSRTSAGIVTKILQVAVTAKHMNANVILKTNKKEKHTDDKRQ